MYISICANADYSFVHSPYITQYPVTVLQRHSERKIIMKKFLTILLCTVMLMSVMSIAVSAEYYMVDKAQVFKPDAFNGDEDPYLTVNADDNAVAWWLSYGYGWFTTIDGYATFMTTPVGMSYWDLQIRDSDTSNLEWQLYPWRTPYMKLRYCIPFATGDVTVVCPFCDGQGFEFTLTGDGQWHDLIIDLCSLDEVNWQAYIDFWNNPENTDGAQLHLTEPMQAGILFNLTCGEEIAIQYDYLAFFPTKEMAEAFDGTRASIEGTAATETEAATEAATEEATEAATEEVPVVDEEPAPSKTPIIAGCVAGVVVIAAVVGIIIKTKKSKK